MECKKFEITLVSTENFPDIRSFGQMKAYAEICLNGESETRKKTNVDVVGETNPRWNFPLDYKIVESSIKEKELEVVVKLYCERSLGDKCIGDEVKIPVKSLFDSGVMALNELSYVVPGTRDGRLKILYSFGDVFLAPNVMISRKAIENDSIGPRPTTETEEDNRKKKTLKNVKEEVI